MIFFFSVGSYVVLYSIHFLYVVSSTSICGLKVDILG